MVEKTHDTKPTKTNVAIQTQVDELLSSRKYFIEKVLPILQEDQDYYTIMDRRSLAKGGAEKLASIFGFTAKFEIDKETMELIKDTLNDVIAYRCDLLDKHGNLKGQGRGADTLTRNQKDPNKTIKMAQKRAFVDAVIRATGLSDIFTQDLEDGEYDTEDIVTFGKHKGKIWSDVPEDYLEYLVQEKGPNTEAAKAELDRRKQEPNAEEHLKLQIMKKAKQLNADLKTKEDFEAFITHETGYTLERKNYRSIDLSLKTKVEKKET